MRNDLMPVQIEIDPLVGAASLGAAEQLAIELPRGSEIVDRKSQVKRRNAHHPPLRGIGPIVETFVSRR